MAERNQAKLIFPEGKQITNKSHLILSVSRSKYNTDFQSGSMERCKTLLTTEEILMMLAALNILGKCLELSTANKLKCALLSNPR